MVTPLFEMATVLRDTENNICIEYNYIFHSKTYKQIKVYVHF